MQRGFLHISFEISQISFSMFSGHLTFFAALSSYKKDPFSSLRCFVGPAALLAARHRFRRAEALPEEDPEVLEATYQVAQALAAEGQCLNVSMSQCLQSIPKLWCLKLTFCQESGPEVRMLKLLSILAETIVLLA